MPSYIDPGTLRPQFGIGTPGYKPYDPSKGYDAPPQQMNAGGTDGQPIQMYRPLGAPPTGTTPAPTQTTNAGGGYGMAPLGTAINAQAPQMSDYMNSLSPSDRANRLAMLRQYNPGTADHYLSALDNGDYDYSRSPYEFTNYLNRAPTQGDLQAKERRDREGGSGTFGQALGGLAAGAVGAFASGGASIGAQGYANTEASNRNGTQSGAPPTYTPYGSSSGIPSDLLGVIGAGSQANAYGNYADWAKGVGQPYRDRLSDSYNNPMGYLSSPEVSGAVQQGTNALSRSLSMGGNPVGNGGALQQLQNYSTNQQLDRLAQYRQQLGGFGGLNAINQSIPGAANAAIGARGNTWNAGGSLLTDIFGRGGVGGSIFGSGSGGGLGYTLGNDNPFANTIIDDGSSTFDPSIDWSSLYG